MIDEIATPDRRGVRARGSLRLRAMRDGDDAEVAGYGARQARRRGRRSRGNNGADSDRGKTDQPPQTHDFGIGNFGRGPKYQMG